MVTLLSTPLVRIGKRYFFPNGGGEYTGLVFRTPEDAEVEFRRTRPGEPYVGEFVGPPRRRY
jgi:hypothetical protein